jgi:hypothetical protein
LIDAKIFGEWEKGVVTVEDYDRILWGPEEKENTEAPKTLMGSCLARYLRIRGVFQRGVMLEKFPEVETSPEE